MKLSIVSGSCTAKNVELKFKSKFYRMMISLIIFYKSDYWSIKNVHAQKTEGTKWEYINQCLNILGKIES